MAQQECTECGRKFTPKAGPGRPRRRCYKCRPSEARRATAPALSPTESAPEPVSVPKTVGLVAAVTAQLEKVDRLDTPEGAITLSLAETLALGGHTASGVAALARELRAALEAATKGAETGPADVVDELKERRARRHSA